IPRFIQLLRGSRFMSSPPGTIECSIRSRPSCTLRRAHGIRGASMPSLPARAEPKITDDEPISLHEAYRVCEEIARAHYELSPAAARLPPADRRIALAAIYAFARQADDVADAKAPCADRLESLDLIERAFLAAMEGEPRGPVLVALADAVDRHR